MTALAAASCMCVIYKSVRNVDLPRLDVGVIAESGLAGNTKRDCSARIKRFVVSINVF